MNIIELEEGLRNLISTQPNVMSGKNADVIAAIKNIIEAHKTFNFRVEEYPEQDILKVGVINESARLEMNFVSYVCQVLQERGINIMLYVPKYAAVYDQTISKYVDNVLPESTQQIDEQVEPDVQQPEQKQEQPEKYIVVDKNEKEETAVEQPIEKPAIEEKSSKPEQVIHSKSEGRDYLMNLLKK